MTPVILNFNTRWEVGVLDATPRPPCPGGLSGLQNRLNGCGGGKKNCSARSNSLHQLLQPTPCFRSLHVRQRDTNSPIKDPLYAQGFK
jgi:hypothetical protein